MHTLYTLVFLFLPLTTSHNISADISALFMKTSYLTRSPLSSLRDGKIATSEPLIESYRYTYLDPYSTIARAAGLYDKGTSLGTSHRWIYCAELSKTYRVIDVSWGEPLGRTSPQFPVGIYLQLPVTTAATLWANQRAEFQSLIGWHVLASALATECCKMQYHRWFTAIRCPWHNYKNELLTSQYRNHATSKISPVVRNSVLRKHQLGFLVGCSLWPGKTLQYVWLRCISSSKIVSFYLIHVIWWKNKKIIATHYLFSSHLIQISIMLTLWSWGQS